MLSRLTLSVFLALFAIQAAFADTFIVTSNADSGPGTLREAITMANANGTSVTDYIHFNITDVSEAGRTILLISSLPSLTSKIVIDASTQPGSTFGISTSKIVIQHSGRNTFSQGIILANVEEVEIYSIYFKGFKYGNFSTTGISCAIYVPGLTKKIKIGAPGKGNVFFDNINAIANRYSNGNDIGDNFIDVEIKSNFIGLKENGITEDIDGKNQILIHSFKNILIGGDGIEDGNFFAGYGANIVYLLSDRTVDNGFVKILNNYFGCNYLKTAPLKCGSIVIEGTLSSGPAVISDAEVTISKNSFDNASYVGSNWCHEMVAIRSIKGYIKITGNKIGTLSTWVTCQTTGISIAGSENGIIGGPDPEDENIISRNYTQGISLYENKNITIQKNSIYCNSVGIRATSTKTTIPSVSILYENGSNFISGKSDPNCKIEVFQTPDCAGCNNGRVFMGETFSDANGDWSFSGAYTSAVTATATSLTGATGEFAKPEFNSSKIKIEAPICNENNGYIKGMEFVKGTRYYWIKNNRDTISNQLDLENVGAGFYEFIVEQTKYCFVRYTATLQDNSPKINSQFHTIIQPSCGLFNGRILNIYTSGNYDKIFWLNEARDTISRTSNLVNAGQGKYKLFIWNSNYNCADSTSWFQLVNQSGPTLNTNNLQITPATCENANGSIKNITATNFTGTPFTQWVDSLNNPVGSSFDLIKVPAGKYKMKFKDQGGCDTIITPFYIIPGIGKITIDESQLVVRPAGCTVANGSISNISVNNANNLEWINISTGQVFSNNINVNNLSAGTYQLNATNVTGCSVQSSIITVTQATFNPIAVGASSVQVATCGVNNGSVQVTQFINNDPAFYSFEWIHEQTNQFTGTGNSISNLGSGTYIINATDTNGCKSKIYSANIIANPKPVINEAQVLITPDQCSLKKGAVSGISISGLLGPTTYSWADQNNNIIGHAKDLTNIMEGSYQLTITDGTSCTIVSNWFTVSNNDMVSVVPIYDNIMIPRNAPVTLKIKNFQTGTYILYADPSGTQILQQNTFGNFTTAPVNSDTYVYVQHINGTCKSAIVPVKITVVDKSYFAIASAFTPNKDGLNDLLRLQVIGYIDVEYFKIFNRNGEEIFSTKAIGNGWNGSINGMEQPSGVFVWMAKGKDINGNIITDKGTFVLIR